MRAEVLGGLVGVVDAAGLVLLRPLGQRAVASRAGGEDVQDDRGVAAGGEFAGDQVAAHSASFIVGNAPACWTG